MKTCTACSAPFDVSADDLAFLDHLSPTIGGKKHSIPPPTHCPNCRQQRRLGVFNEWNLANDQCDLCKKRILMQYSPQRRPKMVYCRECWNGSQWDPCQYGADVDFSRPLFEQVRELRERSPNIALFSGTSLQNSDYVHCVDYLKNCYLIMHADKCEDCYYGYGFKNNRSCVDGYYNFTCELLYDCVDCHRCYGLMASQDCINCSGGGFLRDCIGCTDCFLCVGLREKTYCFENQQLTKDAYQTKLKSIHTGSFRSYQEFQKRRRELELKHTFKESQGHQTENCVGNNLYRCKNAYQCYDCEDVEDARYCTQVVTGAKNIGDIYQWGMNLQSSYECAHAGDQSYNIFFSVQTFLGSDIYCSWFSQSCRDCFGCANMRSKRYCILNKQYTKEEYEKVVPKVIEHMRKTGEWGEFFSIAAGPFGYNKTVAQLHFPLTRKQVEQRGLWWDDSEPPPPNVTKVIPAESLPDDIAQIPDDVLNWAIRCEVTGKPFKLTQQELQVYRQRSLPLPRRYWLQRHFDRFARRNPRTLWDRDCAKCKKRIRTTYQSSRPEIVYCEECYLAAVY